MAALPALHADVSDPRLYREDTWREHFALLRDQDPVHRVKTPSSGPDATESAVMPMRMRRL